MPGFAVYYRYPNSQRVTYSQFIKVSLQFNFLLFLSYVCIDFLKFFFLMYGKIYLYHCVVQGQIALPFIIFFG